MAGSAETSGDVFVANEIVSLSELPGPVLALLIGILGISLYFSFFTTTGAPQKVRGILLLSRLGLLLCVAAILFEPGIRTMEKSKIPNRVVVLLDTSASMQQNENGRPRMESALTAYDELLGEIAGLDAPYQIETLLFDKEISPALEAKIDSLRQVPPEGDATDLASAIKAIDPQRDLPLSAVVLLSDGADTTGLSASLDQSLRENLRRLEAPIHTIGVGSTKDFQDIAIERVESDDFAFVRNKVAIKVVVRHVGFEGKEIDFALREDGKPISNSRHILSESGTTEVELTFEPKNAGKHIYTVELPVLPGETIRENNRIDFAMKVIRDRIRVLQVVGKPSWDERFLRRLLKENPSVDLISFFILRSPSDSPRANNSELSLIPFPTRELFTEELHTFDVVIFQDFNYRPYQMGQYLKNVRDFVEVHGGGFMMLGGHLSFSEGDYAGTPIENILPVRLLPGRGHISEERFRPLLSKAGRTHPITDLGDIVGVDDAYAKLPKLEGINLVAGLQEGAETLLAHPFINAGAEAHPVVAIREVGAGRSVAVMTDTTWAWSLPHVGSGGRGDAHRKFFANTLRWLIRDPELSRVKLGVGRTEYAPGENVEVRVRSFNAKYQPEGGAEIALEIIPLDLATEVKSTPPAPLAGETGDDGVFQTRLEDLAPGAYKIRVQATQDGKKIGTEENAFVIRGAALEVLHAEPRFDVLQAISGAGNGRFVRPESVGKLEFPDHKVEKIHRQKTESIWNAWIFLLPAVFFASLEWWYRRRKGFA